MSDELTAELRRVYADAWDDHKMRHPEDSIHDAALLAVARHSAERQRSSVSSVDATRIAREANKHNDNDWHSQAEQIALNAVQTALDDQSAAPLWVDK